MNKKSMEMTISTVVVLVIGLILLAAGIYIIYTKILKPSEGVSSVISCESRGGTPTNTVGCKGMSCAVCMKLPTDDPQFKEQKELPYCCIEKLI